MGKKKESQYTDSQQAKGEAKWVEQWSAEYEHEPIQNDAELYQRLDDLVAIIFLGIVNYSVSETDVPIELKTAKSVILDVMNYLPSRPVMADALKHHCPDVAANISASFPMKDYE